MGIGTESAMINQLKKAQGETNERLDRIAMLLERLAQAVERQAEAKTSSR